MAWRDDSSRSISARFRYRQAERAEKTMMPEAITQLEEAFPFPLPSFDTGLDEVNNDAVGAPAAGLRQGFHQDLPGCTARKGGVLY
jgi:hypothetical protein